MSSTLSGRRVAVIGAGPIGLEAALEVVTRGWRVTVVEAGRVGEHVTRYGETTLFTPFRMNSTPLGRARLRAEGHSLPDGEEVLRARELVERYLAPLARLPELRDSIRERSRVTHVGRRGVPKAAGDALRERRPFLLRVETADGVRFEEADIVLDASGVYGRPNATGPGGLPATGEGELGERLDRELPSSLASARERFAGRRVLLIGDGHSAATALRVLHDLASESSRHAPEHVDWILRDRGGRAPFEVIPDDPLPARRGLADAANRIAASAPWLSTHRGGTVLAYDPSRTEAVRVRIEAEDGRALDLEVDRVLALVGHRPDLEMTRELRVHYCYASEGPMKLASAILSASGSGGDCLSQVSHGPESLLNTEPGFFIVGAKSYGRNASFLLSIGHRQIQDVLTLMGPARSLPLETAPSTSA